MLLLMVFACLFQSVSLQATRQAAAHPDISLTPSPGTEVVKGLTKDVKLQCELSTSEGFLIEDVITMRIERQMTNGTWGLVADITGGSQVVTVEDSKVSARGIITPEVNGSYFEVTWPVAVDDTIGIYKCRIIGLDVDMNVVSESTQTTEIKDKPPTAAAVLGLLSQYEVRMNNAIAQLRQDAEEERDRMHDENEVTTNNAISQFRNDTRQELDKMDRHTANATANVMASVDDLNKEFQSLKKHFHSEWPEGSFGLLKPQAGCPKDPAFYFGSNPLYSFHSESSNLSYTPQSSWSAGSHVIKPIVYRQFNINWFVLRFCYVSLLEFRSSPWPSGHYCVQADDTSLVCPSGSIKGSVLADEEDEGNQSFKLGPQLGSGKEWLVFCCRASGSYNDPIVLPTASPFYLYRIGGHCQKVAGMSVTEEFLEIDTENTLNSDGYTGLHPDVTIDRRDGRLTLRLCYYE